MVARIIKVSTTSARRVSYSVIRRGHTIVLVGSSTRVPRPVLVMRIKIIPTVRSTVMTTRWIVLLPRRIMIGAAQTPVVLVVVARMMMTTARMLLVVVAVMRTTVVVVMMMIVMMMMVLSVRRGRTMKAANVGRRRSSVEEFT